MKDSPPISNRQIGYCTNVHAGSDLNEVLKNLQAHSVQVKQKTNPDSPLGIGLWLSSTASRELEDESNRERFRTWLHSAGLFPFTINGFPFGDFHQDIVKHAVYRPTWADPRRMDYTIRLAKLLDDLLPAGAAGSISTLPLGWPANPDRVRRVRSTEKTDSSPNRVENFRQTDQSLLESSAQHLVQVARQLDKILESSGREIVVAIEPEPGCLLDTCEDIVQFFEQYLLCGDRRQSEQVRRHLGVCHDVCHSAVMFEPQSVAMNAYADAGIRVGKIQVSSAVEVDFDALDPSDREPAFLELQRFAEPRYLHQTCIRAADEVTFHEDLSLAVEAANGRPKGTWRVHFHVPIHVESFGLIGTTQREIKNCLNSIVPGERPVQHFEVETYAWNVLPEELWTGSLSDGIAAELNWFSKIEIDCQREQPGNRE